MASSTSSSAQQRRTRGKKRFASGLECLTGLRTPVPHTSISVSFEELEAVVFDFDRTITRDHLFELLRLNRPSLDEIAELPYAVPEYCEAMSEVFRYLRENAKIIYIASRNYKDVILHFIRETIDPEFPVENIFADRESFYNTAATFSMTGKGTVFATHEDRLGRFLYIDDDLSEIEDFRRTYPSLNYHHKSYCQPITLDRFKAIFDPSQHSTIEPSLQLQLAPIDQEEH